MKYAMLRDIALTLLTIFVVVLVLCSLLSAGAITFFIIAIALS